MSSFNYRSFKIVLDITTLNQRYQHPWKKISLRLRTILNRDTLQRESSLALARSRNGTPLDDIFLGSCAFRSPLDQSREIANRE